ncbi:MAG: hypothetical protein HC918_12000 [Oscillatoriales cyanobacterium SM2_1_8]|nr:hypothetical protein [Oscillatoriales cyanobacterium SM2_1_8]
MEPYRSAPHSPKRGLLATLGLSSVAGGMAAILLSSLSPWLYLPGGFAVGIGLAAAGGAIAGVRGGKVRSPRGAFLVAAIAGLGSYGVFHGTNFLRFRQAALAEIAQQLDPTEAHRQAEFLGKFLQENVGAAGFWGYLRLVAQEEVAGLVPGRPPFRLFLNPWGLWSLEAIAVASLAGLGGYWQAVGLFSAQMNTWFGQPRRLGYTGDRAVLTLLKAPDLETFRQALQPDRPAAPTYLVVYLWRSLGQEPHSYCLEVVHRQTHPCQPGSWQTVFCAVLTLAEAAVLMANQPPAPDP